MSDEVQQQKSTEERLAEIEARLQKLENGLSQEDRARQLLQWEVMQIKGKVR